MQKLSQGLKFFNHIRSDVSKNQLYVLNTL